MTWMRERASPRPALSYVASIARAGGADDLLVAIVHAVLG